MVLCNCVGATELQQHKSMNTEISQTWLTGPKSTWNVNAIRGMK